MRLTVSETAKLTNISVRTLHYYDEIGLLKPTGTTEAGYRYYDEELTAQNTASRFGMSVQELNRVLMYQLEKNFEEYLNYVRVNRACELLTTTDRSVMDIALDVGYHNAKTLTRNFVKHKLMTPQSFRTAATEG